MAATAAQLCTRYRFDPYATHQPVLLAAARRCAGPFGEFGCGEGSTPLLHAVSEERGVPLVTFEADQGWLSTFERRFASPLHTFVLVDDWGKTLDELEAAARVWGVVFVDQAPWEARAATVRALANRTELLVLHDCDYFAERGIIGESARPLRGADDRGERAYGGIFQFWREFFPPEPWPYPPTGPPTLLASNIVSCDFVVDYP